MSAQDRTIEQYQQLMQLNAASHLIRAARTLGILAELREGQRTLEQLCELLELSESHAADLMDSLVAIGIVEKYGEDYALSRAAHLLCQYDDDLGDARWQRLPDLVRSRRSREENDDRRHHDHLAATQWIHTAAAMEAAEILDFGGASTTQGGRILDLGCGSAVWSCAMAYRDPDVTITAVDHRAALDAAEATARSIGLQDRFFPIDADPLNVELPAGEFDWVVLAQRLSVLSSELARSLVKQAAAAARPGGRVVVIDLLRGPARANLAECVEALKLRLETQAGAIRSMEDLERDLRRAELTDIQFALMSRSRVNFALAVATKPLADEATRAK
jgi:SAM-dependent methyltransferase